MSEKTDLMIAIRACCNPVRWSWATSLAHRDPPRVKYDALVLEHCQDDLGN